MIIFLTKANECDIIIKLSHESESQGMKEQREEAEKRNGSSAVKLLKSVQRKFT